MGMCVVPHCKNHTYFIFLPPIDIHVFLTPNMGEKTVKPSVYTSLLAVYFKDTLQETLTLGWDSSKHVTPVGTGERGLGSTNA